MILLFLKIIKLGIERQNSMKAKQAKTHYKSEYKYHENKRPLSDSLIEESKNIYEKVAHIEKTLSYNYNPPLSGKVKTRSNIPKTAPKSMKSAKALDAGLLSHDKDEELNESQEINKLYKMAVGFSQTIKKDIRSSKKAPDGFTKKFIDDMDMLQEKGKNGHRYDTGKKQNEEKSPLRDKTNGLPVSRNLIRKRKAEKFLKIGNFFENKNEYKHLRREINDLEEEAKTKFGISFTNNHLEEYDDFMLKEKTEYQKFKDRLSRAFPHSSAMGEQNSQDSSIPSKFMSLLSHKRNLKFSKPCKKLNNSSYFRL